MNESIKGRAAAENPANRFETLHVEIDPGLPEEDRPAPHTVFLNDHTQSILSTNNSPDIPFNKSVNPYRGCEHGCIYCYARPTHEFLGFSAGLDFETKILVKKDAAALLRKELAKKSWTPQPVMMSGVTDPYQPVERKLKVTRACLEVFREFRNPIRLITKNELITRDLDLLSEMAEWGGASVAMSITSLDGELSRIMEPRCSQPERRLHTVRALSEAGIPVSLMMGPVVPGLTDHEIPSVIQAAADAGACAANYIMLRLPLGVAPLFESWLERHFPERKNKVLNRIRSIRDGSLNDTRFGERMVGGGPFGEQVRQVFDVCRRKAGLDRPMTALSTSHFRNPDEHQMELF